MWISSVELKNIKGFRKSGIVKFSKSINILIGPNNSGKSTVVNALHCIQSHPDNHSGVPTGNLELSHGTKNGQIIIGIDDYAKYWELLTRGEPNSSTLIHKCFEINIRANGNQQSTRAMLSTGHNQDALNKVPNTHAVAPGKVQANTFPAIEPLNVFYPFLAKRKISNLQEQVNQNSIKTVTNNFDNLISKIDNLYRISHPSHKEYLNACNQILGFEVGTVYSQGGKEAGYIIDEKVIPISAMGEGVLNLLSLIEKLCVAKDKIFLIEELENDLHPKALKAILALIEEKSVNNQFIISTHSNIVTKYLGGIADAKIFQVSSSFKDGLPVSEIRETSDDIIERQKLLEDLGYEFYDYGLWKAWLFLEESSAETIIKEFLIPNFVPKLKGKVQTFSANGVDSIEPKLKDFHKLFVFLHLQPIYKNNVWVMVDGGEKEKQIVDTLKDHYVNKQGWNDENFLQLQEHDFERYYPKRFTNSVDEVLSATSSKQAKKTQLLKEVLDWANDNPEEAKIEFAESSKEVIDMLRGIEAAI